ncbi:hypothetical protein [Cohnella sp. 56]|uniref:hypothetical protein n=1 Tax=Cohnella sp. 56 TaxID=3113722 RepID=UPI0030EA6F92
MFNTLANYMDAASPTGFALPGQTVSGLFGPVALVFGAADAARSAHCPGDTAPL